MSIETTDNYDFIFKIVVMGDAAVGKSTLVERYVEEIFKDDRSYISTLGVAFTIKQINVDSFTSQHSSNHDQLKKVTYSCKLHIWDTAGQERFRAITQSYYRSSNIFIVCFDCSFIGDQEQSVMKWLKDIETYGDVDKPHSVYIIGTRMDKIVVNSCNKDLHKCICQWETSFKNTHIHFIGLCSAIKDQFVERLISEESIISFSQVSMPISVMFKNIVRDHIDNNIQNLIDDQNQQQYQQQYQNQNQNYNQHKRVTFSLEPPERNKQSCCNIL